ncbi:tetratricopeptide repeat protein [Nonomuraea sp. LP-02]|uniref:tetratricopeptide repeat protein n=1 Tax=Nonomuraea sp. LP-02 TaxID=3097960 RepID=UPI002E30600D|nr:tetratricopeptide repeat protein [Nonomuraea sp. LP-02]MED7931750.1 tetratricopeptide repeat protein [Nonomuraea sp. LP-02]
MRVTPLTLLIPEQRAVPYADDHGLLASTAAWATDGEAGAVRLVSGVPGAGKTRLAAELQARGVPCVWARPGEEPPEHADGMVIVVDDADAHDPVGLAEILARAAATRVLVLARSFGLWWSSAVSGDESGLLEGAEHVTLVPAVLDQQSVRAALAERLGVPVPAGAVARSETPSQALESALAEVVGGEVWRREQELWPEPGVPVPPEVLRDALAVAVVLDGSIYGDGELERAELLLRVPGLVDADVEVRVALARWVADAYPEGWPESFMWRMAARRLEERPELAVRLLRELSARRALRALVALARVPDVRLGAVIGADVAALQIVLLNAASTGAARVVDAALAELVGERIRQGTAPSELLPPIEELDDDDKALMLPLTMAALAEQGGPPADAAELRRSRAYRLLELGQVEEAATVMGEAVALFRATPGARTGLALALNNLYICLSRLGRVDEAHAVITEEVELNRVLARNDPGRHDAALAASLSNLSVSLTQRGRAEEALELVREALTFFRGSLEHGPDLAGALANEALALSGLGRDEEALAGLFQALEIRRRSGDPVKLLLVLSNLTSTLRKAGRVRQAAEVAREIPPVVGGLPPHVARINRPLIAGALFNAGTVLPEDGLAVMEAGIAVQRDLAAEDPDRHGELLAGMLRDLERASLAQQVEEHPQNPAEVGHPPDVDDDL